MPKFTVEVTYRMPYYRQRTYDAATVEEACHRAIEDDDWESELADYECAGATYITGIWKGADTAYAGEEIAMPSHCRDTTAAWSTTSGRCSTILLLSPSRWAFPK